VSRTIRDWQRAGVTLKVEVATSGALVVGGNQTDIPFDSGGSYGAPAGWRVGEYYGGEPVAGSETAYNFTTATQVFSVSAKTVPTSRKNAGAWSPSFAITPGFRYQIGVQARRMDGKAVSERSITLETSANGGASWQYYTGSQGFPALTDWEDVLQTGSTLGAGRTLARIQLLGAPPYDSLGLWGTQFQKLYVRQLDLEPPPLTWRDITCDVRSLGIRYGRERFTNRYDVSTMGLELINDEGEYSFHSPHPFGLQPGRQVRVSATYKGVTYPQAFHVLDTITDGYSMEGHVISRWQCVDPTTTLSNAETKTFNSEGNKSGQRIAKLLDQVGYVPRITDTGQWYCQTVTASGRSVRDECGVTADSEGGNFFADRQGNCVYKDRTWQTTDTNLQHVMADLVGYPHVGVMPVVDDTPTDPTAPIICTNELVTDWSLARVINYVELANAGGNAKTFSDPTSMKTYGPQTYQRMDFVLRGENELAIRADDIMSGYSDPVLRVNSVGYAPGVSAAWEFTLGVFLNWLVRVWYTHPTNYWGFAVCVHVQSIEHRITPDDWSTTMAVDLPESFAELEWASANGWDEGTWDETLWDQGDEKAGAQWDEGYKWNAPNTKWGI
jgi:hypothetical protein